MSEASPLIRSKNNRKRRGRLAGSHASGPQSRNATERAACPTRTSSTLLWGPRAEGRGRWQPGLAWPGGSWCGSLRDGRRPRLAGPHKAPIGAHVQRPHCLVEAPVLPDPDAPPYDLEAPSADPVACRLGLQHRPRGRGRSAVHGTPVAIRECRPDTTSSSEGRTSPAQLWELRLPHRNSGVPAELFTRRVAHLSLLRRCHRPPSDQPRGPELGGGRARLRAADSHSAP